MKPERNDACPCGSQKKDKRSPWGKTQLPRLRTC
ncbi:SEC-C metal-binding domain-containing protein [Halomonas sp. HNIBRBA4712]